MSDIPRFMGLCFLLLGILAVGLWFPSAPAESWDFIHAFEFGSEECRALRQSRETTEFECTESIKETVTVGEIARRYNLELSLVCQVNGLPAGCRSEQVAPGETLILPLGRRQSDLRPTSAVEPGR